MCSDFRHFHQIYAAWESTDHHHSEMWSEGFAFAIRSQSSDWARWEPVARLSWVVSRSPRSWLWLVLDRYSGSNVFVLKLQGDHGSCAGVSATQYTEYVGNGIKKCIEMELTRYGDVSFQRTTLRIGKEEHDSFTIMPTKDSEILADTLFSTALGLGLGHAAQEDQFGA